MIPYELAYKLGPYFFKLAESSQDVFWIRDATYQKQLYISPAYEKLWGRSRESLYSNPNEWFNYVHPDDLELVNEYLQSIENNYNDEKIYVNVYRIIRPNAQICWVKDHVIQILGPSQKVIGFAGMAQDISHEKEQESKLQIANLFLPKLADRMENSVFWVRDPSLKKQLYISPAFEKIWGYSSNEIYEHPELWEKTLNFAEYTPQKGGEMLEIFNRNKENSQFQNTYKILNSKGESKWIKDISFPIYDDNNKFMGFAGIATDITTEKLYEEQLILAKEQAEEASKAKAEFIANMSRDFINSMNTITNMANMIGSKPLGVEEEGYVKTITETARTLTDYIKDILRLSDPKLNKLPIIYKPLDLRQLIEDIASAMIPLANQRGLRFMVDYPDNVPYAIISDSHRLRRILHSLVENAIKFTSRGHILITVECIEIKNDTAKLRILIEDTGIGIPQDKLQLIFERFSRLSTAYENKIEGAGLGLNVAKQFIEHLDGKISVESQLSIGSTFAIELPCNLQESSIVKSALNNNLADIRILLVDDSLSGGKTFIKQLNNSRHDFTSSASALSMLEQSFYATPYSIVVIDDEITNTSFLKLAKLIRQNPQFDKVMLILLSRINSMKIIKKSKQAGFFECFIKPIQPSELPALLSNNWQQWLNQKVETEVSKIA